MSVLFVGCIVNVNVWCTGQHYDAAAHQHAHSVGRAVYSSPPYYSLLDPLWRALA